MQAGDTTIGALFLRKLDEGECESPETVGGNDADGFGLCTIKALRQIAGPYADVAGDFGHLVARLDWSILVVH